MADVHSGEPEPPLDGEVPPSSATAALAKHLSLEQIRLEAESKERETMIRLLAENNVRLASLERRVAKTWGDHVREGLTSLVVILIAALIISYASTYFR